MTCTVCGKPASIIIGKALFDTKDNICLCDKCARVIVQEIEANMEGK